MAPNIVSCEWLYKKISRKDTADIAIVDVSWVPDKDCQEEYKRYDKIFQKKVGSVNPFMPSGHFYLNSLDRSI